VERRPGVELLISTYEQWTSIRGPLTLIPTAINKSMYSTLHREKHRQVRVKGDLADFESLEEPHCS